MRKQYHFCPAQQGVLICDVDRLVELTKDFPRIEVPLSEIRELDETFWFDVNGYAPTCRRVAMHAKLIDETNLKHPIILSQDGGVMDGMHRVCRALIEGRTFIHAVRFEIDPEPDYVDVSPDDLPY